MSNVKLLAIYFKSSISQNVVFLLVSDNLYFTVTRCIRLQPCPECEDMTYWQHIGLLLNYLLLVKVVQLQLMNKKPYSSSHAIPV